MYGTLFDSTCLLWGARGNCWYYDNDILRLRFFGVTATFYSLGTACIAVMSYYAAAIGNMYSDEDPVKSKDGEELKAHKKEKEAMLPT